MCDGRTFDLESGVAPRFKPLLGSPQPHLTDAKSGDERDALHPVTAIDDDQLPMIAAQPAQRARQLWWVEHSHLTARAEERRKQTEHWPEPAAEPVVDHPYRHPLAGPLRELGDEPPAHVVAMDDVHLDVD